MRIEPEQAREWVDLVAHGMEHLVLIPVEAPNRIALNAVAFARTMLRAPDCIEAVHVTDDRETAEALLRYLDVLEHERGSAVRVTVLLPETLPSRWWHPLLHNYLAWRLKWALLFRPGASVLSVPYFVRE